jgi:hypothetical protein
VRVNVYAEEMTDRIEIISKEIDGHRFTGLRFYLELPASFVPAPLPPDNGDNERPATIRDTVQARHYQAPFIHRPGDDDSSAVTFWGKRDLRMVLRQALAELDAHYEGRNNQ